MSIKAIIAKAIKGEALSEEEKTTLESFDPDSLTQTIDEAKKTAKEATENLKVAKKAESEAKSALEAAKREKMTDTEKLQSDLDAAKTLLDAATADKETTNNELATLKRSSALNKLIAIHGFEDVDYLDHLLAKKQLAPDADSVESYMKELKATSPRFFKADVKSGSSGATEMVTPKSPPSAASSDNNYRGRIDNLIEALGNAPEAKS